MNQTATLPLDTPVASLPMSLHLKRLCIRNGLHRLADVLPMNLHHRKGFGPKTIAAIEVALKHAAQHGPVEPETEEQLTADSAEAGSERPRSAPVNTKALYAQLSMLDDQVMASWAASIVAWRNPCPLLEKLVEKYDHKKSLDYELEDVLTLLRKLGFDLNATPSKEEELTA